MGGRKGAIGAIVSEDSGLVIAALADTSEDLDRLFADKPDYWEFAAFTSLLVQGRSKMQRLIDAHHDRYAPHSNQQIDTVDELDYFFTGKVVELLALVENFEEDTNTHLRRLFADQDLYDEVTPQEVRAAAKGITDFYRSILLLTREVRSVQAPSAYSEVIENLASLIGFHLKGVDDFITATVGFLAVLPTLARSNSGNREYHSLALELDPDYALLNHIKGQIKRLRQPWRRWLWWQ